VSAESPVAASPSRFRAAISRWVFMAVLGLSGAVIYLLPFLREVYYEPLQNALGIDNRQSGVLMATFGFTSMLAYVPGGWLADRVEARALIAGALVTTGLLGFWFARFPTYETALLIHALWGVTCTGLMWGALIKATRDWASARDQGKAFGLLEAGRGVSEAALLTLFLSIFARLGGDERAFASIVVQYSALHVALGVAAWFAIAPGLSRRDGETMGAPGDFVRVMKMPTVWLIAIVVLAGYSAYWGAYYFTPYASDVFMMSAVMAGAIGAGKVWLKPASALLAGLAADRTGVSKAVAACFIVLIASFAAFSFLPGGGGAIWFMVVNIAVASIAIFALRGIYFALLEETAVPVAATGTAAGFVSVVGFTPDIFMPLLGGALLDAYPGAAGYRLFFGAVTSICVAGLVATLLLQRRRARSSGAIWESRPII
jgi:nitrate/nitrite transporter NarK